jgi:hypothetical protein
MNDQATISDRIAGALGDDHGSYEQLMGGHICIALGVDPAFRGQLIPTPKITKTTAKWLRDAAKAPAESGAHASEILAALQL